MYPNQKTIYILFAVLALSFMGTSVYGFLKIKSLSSQLTQTNSTIASLSENVASSTEALQIAIDLNHTNISSALSAEQQNVGNLQQQIQNQVGSLSGTVSTLQKLSQTDSQLLVKYSKVYFLNENYVPAHLSEIPLEYQYSTSKQMLIETDVLPRLTAMINNASSTGVKLYINSAYRSFDEQKNLKSNYKVTYGAGTANSFSADQGYSEHQLGTAVDLTTVGLGGGLTGFDKTAAYTWMTQNAYLYGFVLSYPKDNSYYIYEPWHWRFIGVKLATDLHNQSKNFYDLDQRTIDTYLVSILIKN